MFDTISPAVSRHDALMEALLGLPWNYVFWGYVVVFGFCAWRTHSLAESPIGCWCQRRREEWIFKAIGAVFFTWLLWGLIPTEPASIWEGAAQNQWLSESQTKEPEGWGAVASRLADFPVTLMVTLAAAMTVTQLLLGVFKAAAWMYRRFID